MASGDYRLVWENAEGNQGECVLTRAGALIGSNPACDVCLDSDEVSGFHSRLARRQGGQWSIMDLASRGETLVNGTRVYVAPLAEGDRIQVGDRSLVFLRCAEEEAAADWHLEFPPEDERRRLVVSPDAVAGRPLTTDLLDSLDEAVGRLCRADSLGKLLDDVAAEVARALGPDRVAVGVDQEAACEWRAVLDGACEPVDASGLPVRLVPQVEAAEEGGAVSWEVFRHHEAGEQGSPVSSEGCVIVFPIRGLEGRRLGRICTEAARPAWQVSDEQIDFLALLARQTGLVWENMELRDVSSEAESLHRELDAARRLQLNLFPTETDLHPRLDIAGRNVPALSVSGDYYDFRTIGPDCVAIILADAMGHGLPSALLMSSIQGCFRLGARSGWDLSRFDRELNEMVLAHGEEGYFVTGVLVFCDMESETLRVLAAGHPWPLILCGGQRGEKVEEAATFAWGMTRERDVRPAEFPIAGDPWCLITYTDGISDVRDASGKRYSSDRIAGLHEQLGEAPADSCCEAILSEVLASLGEDGGVRDDMTLVVARSRGGEAAAS